MAETTKKQTTERSTPAKKPTTKTQRKPATKRKSTTKTQPAKKTAGKQATKTAETKTKPTAKAAVEQEPVQGIETLTVTAAQLMDICGLTGQRIRQYAEEGTMKRVVHGRYELISSVKAYIQSLKLQSKAKRRDDILPDQVQHIDTERAIHEHIKIEMSKIRLALMEGRVHKAEDIERVMTDMLMRFKSKLQAIPSQIAPTLEGKNKGQIKSLLDIEIEKALDELSEYDAEDFRSDDYIDIPDEEVEAVMSSGKKDA